MKIIVFSTLSHVRVTEEAHILMGNSEDTLQRLVIYEDILPASLMEFKLWRAVNEQQNKIHKFTESKRIIFFRMARLGGAEEGASIYVSRL